LRPKVAPAEIVLKKYRGELTMLVREIGVRVRFRYYSAPPRVSTPSLEYLRTLK